ncbi:MAG TPA: DegT/DnrJ/EryC1/StrS aminotransferase family protein [Burkholderiales bacterium]|nr:DegT/DnrJ/EryC1/StrS aminotransferase family protein [Burkholderiales bacterium]
MEYLPFTRPSIDETTIEDVVATLRSGWLATGPRVARFEAALSGYLGGRIIKSFTSATAALEIALEAAGISDEHEVITPAISFTATPNVILRRNATPVFIDVDLKTRNMDMEAAAHAVTPKTRALMPVHFAGLPVEMNTLYDLANKHNLRVIEDAAHAIGSRYKGKLIGSFGDLVSFSFHPNKNITTIEGGALSLVNTEEAEQIDILRFHGISRRDDGEMDVLLPGGKYNLSDVAAAVGLGQLPHLDAFNIKRRQLAQHYLDRLEGLENILLPEKADSGHSWHMFAPLINFKAFKMTRRAFIAAMHEKGIGIGIHYPALHLFTLYRSLGYARGDFPNAERIGEETVTLPLFPGMTVNDVNRVISTLCKILGIKEPN